MHAVASLGAKLQKKIPGTNNRVHKPKPFICVNEQSQSRQKCDNSPGTSLFLAFVQKERLAPQCLFDTNCETTWSRVNKKHITDGRMRIMDEGPIQESDGDPEVAPCMQIFSHGRSQPF